MSALFPDAAVCGVSIPIRITRAKGRPNERTVTEYRPCNRKGGHDGPHRHYDQHARVIAELAR